MAVNIRPYIIINGKSSDEITGLMICSLPPISKPAMRVEAEEIDGRNGDIVTELGFSAYDKEIEIGLTGNYDVNDIIEYFNQSGQVIFSNEPDKYYRFSIYNAIDFEKLIRFKTATVTFHVQPFKFDTEENDAVFYSPSSVSITNEGNIYSKPELAIQGSGDVGIAVNGSDVLEIALGETEQAIIIDSEGMNAYGTRSNIKNLDVAVNPVQNLNGYDHAWAGGFGKNKFPFDGQHTIVGNTVFEMALPVSQSYYTLSFVLLNSSAPYALLQNIAVTLTFSDDTTSVISAISSIKYNVPFRLQKALKSITIYASNSTSSTYTSIIREVQIEAGSRYTTYEPYENICPISGWDECNVTHSDENNVLTESYSIQFDETIYKAYLNFTTGVLTIIGEIVDLSSATANRQASGHFRIRLTDYLGGRDILCNALIAYSDDRAWADRADNSIMNKVQNYYNLDIGISSLDTLDDFNAFKSDIDGNGTHLMVCLMLTTPIEIQLTAEEINSFIGINKYQADTGAISDLTYTKDGEDISVSGNIVTFDLDAIDLIDTVFKNRLVTGNYDDLQLKAGQNEITITGDVSVMTLSNYSRWL